MPLNRVKDIDKEAALPKGIEFRKELIWENIQVRKKSRFNILMPWAAAALVILGLGLTFLAQQEMRPAEEVTVNWSGAKSAADSLSLENPPVILQVPNVVSHTPSPQEPEKVELRKASEPIEKKPEEIPHIPSPSPELVNSLRLASIDSFGEPSAEEKSLSPAASRLQKSIQKMNPNRNSQQAVVGERLDLIKKIQNYPIQASSNSNTNSGLNSLFYGKLQQN